MSKCPFHGCETRIGPSLFACKKHWYSMCDSDRDKLWAAYNQYRHGALGLEDLRSIQQKVLGRRGTIERPVSPQPS